MSDRRTALPTAHTLAAALHVAAIVDARGSDVSDAARSYWHRATGGIHSPADLAQGEALLLGVDLLRKTAGRLYPAPVLAELLDGDPADASAVILARWAASSTELPAPPPAGPLEPLISDARRAEELALSIHQRFDDQHRQEVGEIGEELVVGRARSDLRALGRDDLARAVRRVSLLSDRLGFDVEVPRLNGPPLHLEVKATTEPPTEATTIYLSRNEAAVAARDDDWFLVACHVTDRALRHGRIVGWCTVGRLRDHLPTDNASGRWESVRIDIPADALDAGLPWPVL